VDDGGGVTGGLLDAVVGEVGVVGGVVGPDETTIVTDVP